MIAGGMPMLDFSWLAPASDTMKIWLIAVL